MFVMPKYVYSPNVVEQAKNLRRYGYTYREIAGATGMKLTAVVHPPHHIDCPEDGHRPVWKSVSDLLVLLEPGDPFDELPVPKGFLASLEERKGKP